MAALREVPFGLYYGSVDSTPLFVLLAGLYAERTGDLDTIVELWPAIEAALAWIDGPGDPDGDGFVEYIRATEQGLANQGWKDSHDAIFHADGRLAEGAIALVEVQGYVYAAKRMAARVRAAARPRCRWRDKLDAEASRLAERFEAAFWCPEHRHLCAGARRRKKAVPSAHVECRASSVHAASPLPIAPRAWPRDLLQPSFFSGWGIRTVAKGEARYNPMSYHNGSIWPHDNCADRARLGALRPQARGRNIIRRPVQRRAPIWTIAACRNCSAASSASAATARRFIRSPARRRPGPARTPFTLLEASLGLEFDPFKGEIRLRNPRLPAFLDEVMLRDLRLSSSSVDLRVRRHGETVSLDTPRISGDIRVSIVFSS